jgi:hypothetical protein
MARRHELALFAVRTSGGGFQLMTDGGIVVVEAASWRELRRKLALALTNDADRPAEVVLLVGRPRPRPSAAAVDRPAVPTTPP